MILAIKPALEGPAGSQFKTQGGDPIIRAWQDDCEKTENAHSMRIPPVRAMVESSQVAPVSLINELDSQIRLALCHAIMYRFQLHHPLHVCCCFKISAGKMLVRFQAASLTTGFQPFQAYSLRPLPFPFLPLGVLIHDGHARSKKSANFSFPNSANSWAHVETVAGFCLTPGDTSRGARGASSRMHDPYC
eukprot:2531307-Amphidinium_carterae.2